MIQLTSSEWDTIKAEREAEYQAVLAWSKVCRNSGPVCDGPCECFLMLWEAIEKIQNAGK